MVQRCVAISVSGRIANDDGAVHHRNLHNRHSLGYPIVVGAAGLHLPNTFLCENAKFDRLLALLVSVNAGASGSYSGFLGEKRTDDAYCLIDVQCLFAHRRDIVYRVFRITQGSAASDHLGGKIL